MTEEIPEEFWQAVDQFNAQDFYACHDTLEALWMDAVEPDKKFYQGVLQIAVSLYHLGNLNWRGAAILLGEGISRLGYYSPEYYTINVEKLLTESQEILRALQASGPDNVAEFAQQLFTPDVVAGSDKIARLQVPQIVKVIHSDPK
jgi:predicted metal-dependent hydrolase